MAADFDLSDRVAIITGGNGGIGLGMARALARADRGLNLGPQCAEERRGAGGAFWLRRARRGAGLRRH
jgi:NAD(P)-dependent dehydrogenase (short-subunit alcohol dehydrogenase family)